MKRKSWTPDDPHRELRGVDEWERISWDEALDYFADELKKAKAEVGNESILYMNMINLEGYLGQVLSAWEDTWTARVRSPPARSVSQIRSSASERCSGARTTAWIS